MEQSANYRRDVRNGRNNPNFSNPLQQFDRIGRFKPKLLKPKIIFKLLICRKNYQQFPQLEHPI